MFLSDQWLRDDNTRRKQADTTLFFEPIFRKHGYSFKDYDRSIKHYLEKPDEFAKIFNQVSDELREEGEKDRAELDRIREFEDMLKSLGEYVAKDFSSDSSRWNSPGTLWPEYVAPPDTLTAPPADSTAVETDTVATAPSDDFKPERDLKMNNLE